MGKKQKNKEKQIIKKKEKEKREVIINSYITKVKALLEDAYIDMAVIIEEFNEELVKATINYNSIRTEIIGALKQTDDIDALEEIAQKAIESEKRNVDLYLTITSENINENKILKQIAKVSSSIKDVIDEANRNLRGQKNDVYMTSIIIDRSTKLFLKYHNEMIEASLDSNAFIDNYINAREDFLDFLNSIEEVEENSNNTKVIKEIDANIKYKERLRISYYELEKFLKYKGFESVRQGNTTHAIWKHKETGLSIPVPNKSRTMPQGTVSKILRMINSNRHELAQFLK